MKRVIKKIVGVLVLLVSIGSFYMWKQVQKHGKTRQQDIKQKYIDAKTEKPIIHLFDDNKFVFIVQKDGIGGIAFGQDYISVLDVHQKEINQSMIDREKNGSPKIAKDEYFNIISYDLNATGFPSKKTEVYQLLGKKEYRGAYDISQYYADNKDYIPVTLYKVGNNDSRKIIVDISNQKIEDLENFEDYGKSTFSVAEQELSKGNVYNNIRQAMQEKYHLKFTAGYIDTLLSKEDREKIDISNTNFAQDYPEMAKDIKNLARLYMRPKQYSTKEWFDTVLHWFAPKGQDVLEVYATDPKTGEKTQIKSYDELQVWSANHPE